MHTSYLTLVFSPFYSEDHARAETVIRTHGYAAIQIFAAAWCCVPTVVLTLKWDTLLRFKLSMLPHRLHILCFTYTARALLAPSHEY